MPDAPAWTFTLLAQNEPPAGQTPPATDGGGPATSEGADGLPATGQGPAGERPDGGGGGFGGLLLPMILVMVVLWVFLLGGNRKEKKRRAEMLSSLSKGDRVQTVGGILGNIVELRDDEVILKVDENTNARLRFARSAIQTRLEDKKSEEVEAPKS